MTDHQHSSLPTHLGGLTSWREKDLRHEAKLASMNAMAAKLQPLFEEGMVAPANPPIFVLGPPRGGTTLTMQMLASTGVFATATNFVSRFWTAPALGVMIQDAIGLDASTFVSNFESTRGATAGWLEPSEFGYFWSSYFDLGQSTHHLSFEKRRLLDISGLRRALASMEKQAARPLAFKNNTWFTLNADLVAEIFPGCTLVACERDPFFVAQSLWLQRKALYNDVSKWWSVRPQNYEQISKLMPIEQVAAQALSICTGMEESLARTSGARIVRVPYVSLVKEPRALIAQIVTTAGVSSVDIEASIARVPERLASTNQVRLTSQDEKALRAALERLGG